MTLTIVKRDGTTVLFDSSKITDAVRKALEAVNSSKASEKIAELVTKKVVESLGQTTTVEECQNCVELVLSRHDFSAARAYIIYREQRARARQTQSLSKRKIDPKLKHDIEESMRYFKDIFGYTTYLRTYARWIREKGRREHWQETVERYFNFIRSVHNNNDVLTPVEWKQLQDAVLTMQVMPSMRGLQCAGPMAARNNLCFYNCAYLSISTLQDFRSVLMLLMMGCGVGFSTERKYIDQLPIIQPQRREHASQHTVADSREGWCEALLLGITAWYEGRDIEFDYSAVRPAGARLETTGGTASGPAPLKEMLDFARKLILDNVGRRLTSSQVYDLICMEGKAVKVGGVRRAALINLSDFDDKEMRDAKVGVFWEKTPWRSNSNNSAVYQRQPSDSEFLAEFNAMVQARSGERGIFSRSALPEQIPQRRLMMLGDEIVGELGCNPCCVTAETWILTCNEEGDQLRLVQVADLMGSGIKRRRFVWTNEGVGTSLTGFIPMGKRPVVKLTTLGGLSLVCTPDHRLLTLDDGWKEVQALTPQDRIVLSNWQGKQITFGDKLPLKLQSFFESKTPHRFDTMISRIDMGERETFDMQVEGLQQYSANGFVAHNCEILLQSHQLCNLSSVIARAEDTQETLLEKFRLASILGTLQSTLTNFANIDPKFAENVRQERLLGVSITGIQECPQLKEASFLAEAKTTVITTNQDLAIKLGIPASTCTTCIKPEGTLSCVVGTHAAGIHYPHDRYYIRRVRMNALDPLAQMLKFQDVPWHYETGQNELVHDTLVFEFPMKCEARPEFLKRNVSALQALEDWKLFRTQYTEHNVSVTISVGDNEWIDVLHWLKQNWSIVNGISFLNRDDSVYLLAPYESIDETEYEKRIREFPQIDFSRLVYYETVDGTNLAGQMACGAGGCDVY